MLSFRPGATSYVLPDDLAPNVRYLSARVRDVELVLFDLPEGPGNLPDPAGVAELARLAQSHALSYTVHLPLDLRLLDEEGGEDLSLCKARQVIEITAPLEPWAYIAHLDGRAVRQGAAPADLLAWQDQAVQALARVAGWAGGAQRLALENLEGYPLDFLEPVLERFPAARCVDVGHLWCDGHDPLPYLLRALPRTRVVHLHGLNGRDHQSLAHMAPQQVDRVLSCLLDQAYAGVLTLEVFGLEDFQSSLQALHDSLARLQR